MCVLSHNRSCLFKSQASVCVELKTALGSLRQLSRPNRLLVLLAVRSTHQVPDLRLSTEIPTTIQEWTFVQACVRPTPLACCVGLAVLNTARTYNIRERNTQISTYGIRENPVAIQGVFNDK